MDPVDRRSLLAAALLTASLPLVPTRGARAMAARTVQAGRLTIGAGRPKTIVSITSADTASALAHGRELGTNAAIDMVELRVDHLAASTSDADVANLTRALKDVLDGKALMVTFRTKAEGGERAISDAGYVSMYSAVMQSGHADLIDLEMHRTKGQVRSLQTMARAAKVAVVMSNHHFEGTPTNHDMIATLRQMQTLDADIIKLAVMPHDVSDVLRLLSITAEVHANIADRPMITMSMGGIGSVSRLSGEVFGSSATFGAVGAVSAPGQIEVGDLAHVLDVMHRALTA